MEKYLSRRNFLEKAGAGILGLMLPNYFFPQDKPKIVNKTNFSAIPSPSYHNISHNPIKWESIAEGLEFSRTEIYRNKELVDIIASIKINPEYNKIRVFNGYNSEGSEIHTIEDWQKKTNALVMINGNQYREKYSPTSLVICDGEQKGPKTNTVNAHKGMLLAEPNDLEGKLKKIDLLDFDYDEFDYKTTPYTQGVQHWPILLDREGKIKVSKSDWQANRTVVSKTKKDEILFMTTEGGYFTLYNFGRFLKESNLRADKGFNVHTAMNMDGGQSSEMVLKISSLEYLNYGRFASRDPKTISLPSNLKVRIPVAIGIFSRV